MVAPLIASCIFMAISCLVAEVARIFINKAAGLPQLTKTLCLEFVASAELCAVCFELIIVAEEYGIWMYALLLFLLTLWWAAHWGDAAACPYIHLEAYLDGSSTFSDSFLASLAELAGGLAVFRYVQYTWNLQLSDGHVQKSVWECEADLHVPALQGALVEGVATFLCRMVSKSIAELEPRFGGVLDAFIGTSLVVAACDYSGGYFNPVLATSLKLNCRGNTFMEHIVVYWIGSIAGSSAAWYLFKKPLIHNSIVGNKSSEKEKLN